MRPPAAQPDPDDLLERYDYPLDPARIAAQPCAQRDLSRLLVYDRREQRVHHAQMRSILQHLRAGDLLVLNDTQVIPARLQARRESGARVEILLHPTGLDPADVLAARSALALLRPSARIRSGEVLLTRAGLAVRVEDPPGAELRRVSFDAPLGELLREGSLPLPPYLPREESGELPEDRERYQTVFAANPGAVAAPTAGLHFTDQLLEGLRSRGVRLARLTLHVGPGTFLPVRTALLSEHSMHEEVFAVSPETAEAVAEARASGGRVVAVGTTTTRALESAADERGIPRPGPARTRLMIRPPYRFRCVDALLTNFHLPRSTLLALVAAFAGRETILRLYREAAERQYRFYSYGDAMLLL